MQMADVKFISNKSIYQGGAGSFALNLNANTSSAAQNVLFDIRTGDVNSTITEGPSSITTTGASSLVNYLVLTNGAPISVTTAKSYTGLIRYDNTCLDCGTTGFSGTIPSSSAVSGITTSNAWNNATTTSAGISISNNLTAGAGIFINGVVGASSSTANPAYSSVLITGGTLTSTGTFTAGSDAIQIIGTMPVANTSSGVYAVGITGTTSIVNNSTRGNINIKAINGNYYDPVTVTSSSNSGAIEVSAIGASAAIVSASGTLFTQNSNSGVFIASSNSGNVSPPKIINNGTGPVVIGAGIYLNAGDGTGGQITGVTSNSIAQNSTGITYLYSGSPSATTGLSNIASALGTQSTSNAVFNVAAASGNIAFTSLPAILLSAYNTASVTSMATTANPVIQYRLSPQFYIRLKSNSFSKFYSTDDSVALTNYFNSTTNPLAYTGNWTNTNATTGAVSSFSTANGGSFTFTLGAFTWTYTLAQVKAAVLAASIGNRPNYGTVATEQVGTYTYNSIIPNTLFGGTFQGIAANTSNTPLALVEAINPVGLLIGTNTNYKSYTSQLTSAQVFAAAGDTYGTTTINGVEDRKSTRLNSSHVSEPRMPSSACTNKRLTSSDADH